MQLLLPRSCGKDHQLPQIAITLLVSLTSLSCGLLYAWTSPSIPKLVNDPSLDISLDEASYFTVIHPLSMGVFSVLQLKVIDKVGRKLAIIATIIPQLVSWLLIAFAQRIELFYLSRVMAGIADAGAFSTITIYVCEISEAKVRDTWNNAISVSLYLGVLLVNVVGSYFSITDTALMFACIPIIQIALFIFAPESPYYLLARHRTEEARCSLQLLRWRSDVDEEMEQLEADVQRQISESCRFIDIVSVKSHRKAFVICLAIRTIQQFSGLSAIESHTQYMFANAGVGISESLSSIIFAAVLMVTVTISWFVMDKFRRKSLLLVSCFGSAFCLGIDCIYLGIRNFTDLDLSSVSWISLSSIIAYTLIFGFGLATLPTSIVGEMFSSSVKAKASFLLNLCFALQMLLIPKLFHLVTENFDLFYSFSFFAISATLGGVFCCYCIIETKGKTLEEIQQALKGDLPIKSEIKP
ncbi:facilitated trehalose transporter Tret1-like [Photinus pyralis]|nr:facilitated trehalose transporter Tret1-like [Photinus pyralis]